MRRVARWLGGAVGVVFTLAGIAYIVLAFSMA